jgi:hypothetical protein
VQVHADTTAHPLRITAPLAAGVLDGRNGGDTARADDAGLNPCGQALPIAACFGQIWPPHSLRNYGMSSCELCRCRPSVTRYRNLWFSSCRWLVEGRGGIFMHLGVGGCWSREEVERVRGGEVSGKEYGCLMKIYEVPVEMLKKACRLDNVQEGMRSDVSSDEGNVTGTLLG